MKVMLIEDNPNYAFLVEAMLRSSDPDNMSFSWAENLCAGIQQLQRQAADVILLDLSLPDSDDLATLTTLKANAGMTPIIVLTGCNNDQLANEALRHGAQDYLLKTDLDKHGLLRALRYAIERTRYEDKYRDLVESLEAIVWEADPVTWRFTYVNKAAKKILGYPIERWLQTPDFWVNLIHPEDRLATVDNCRQHIESGDQHELVYRVIALDGRIVWLRDLVRVIKDASGRPTKLCGTMIEITRAKGDAAKLEQQHFEAETLQEIGRMTLEATKPNIGIHQALEKTVAALGFDLGDVLLTTPQGELMSVVAACGYRDPANRQRTPRPQSSLHRRAQLKHSEVIKNIQLTDRFRSLQKEGAKTALIVPLRTNDESLGILQLASRSLKDIRANELALAEAIGRQIGIAIQKSKLTEELQTSLRRVNALYESNVAITSTLDLPATLDIILEKIATVSPPDTAIKLELLDGDTGELERVVMRNLDEEAWIREFCSPGSLATGGLRSHALKSETPLVIQALRTDPRVQHPGYFHDHGLSSYLGLPIRIKDRPVGVVGIYTRTPHEFSGEEIRSMASMASHAAVAIHNAKVYAEVEKKSQALAALFDVSTAASRSLDADLILHEVAQRITQIFAFDATRVLLFDDHKERLLVRASHESREGCSVSPKVFLKGQGISGHAAASGEAIIIENIDIDPRYEKLTCARSAAIIGQKFVAAFPITYKEEVLGVITCVAREPRRMTDHELQLITSISNQIAVAVHNARLYGKVEKQSRGLSALCDVTTAATDSLEMDRILHKAIRRIYEIFNFDATRFYLFDDEREWLHCRATYQENSGLSTRTSSFKKGQGITGRVAAAGTAIIIDDAQTNPQYQLLSRAKNARQRFIGGFPVTYGSQTLGVIMCLGNLPRQLTQHEIDLIASLSSPIAVAITNARLYEQTRKQAEQLRQLAMHLESVREHERTRISRELHDELGQALTALKFDVAWINGKLSETQAPLAVRLATMSKSIDDTIQSVRKISARLRPDILDKLGLSAAIEWHLQEFRQRTGIQYHYFTAATNKRLSERHSTVLFRILQETLTNVARHSQASQIKIDLQIENGTASLQVQDDGRGIEANRMFDGKSLGLLGMREHAASLGGNLTIECNRAQGTTVTAHIPIEEPSEMVGLSSRMEEL